MNELIYLLLLLTINSFVIIGWNKATHYETEEKDNSNGRSVQVKWKSEKIIIEDSKMLLWKLRYWFENRFGAWAAKPFFSCPTCMSSVHSTYAYWFFQPFTLHSLLIYPIYILSLAGLVTYINNRV